MTQTFKSILDSSQIILTRFSKTDESRLDENWFYYKLCQIRAELIINQYAATKLIDYTWISSPMILNFYKTNRADSQTVNCPCDVSKSTIPQTISLLSPDGNLDLGIFSLKSMCGTKSYTLKRITQWSYIPDNNTFSLFPYYDRRNTDIYVNRNVDKLIFEGILLDPTEGYFLNTAPITSGSLVNGTVYIVNYGTIIYNSVPYESGATFTATATATFTGSGKVYLNSQARAFRDTDPYPASGEMIRQIELEILTKEFGLEAKAINDVRNDSVDDANK